MKRRTPAVFNLADSAGSNIAREKDVAVGAAVAAGRKRSRSREWFDDDALWRELYPFLFPKERFEQAVEDVDKALALAAPPGKSALDLCCGPGRCAIPLAQKGFAVTGVDRTRYLLDRARRRARTAGVRIEWVQEDMRDFVRRGAFDLVLSMFTSFGYFDDKEEDLAVLRNVFDSLKPGGAFLIETVGKELIAKSFQLTTSEALPDGSMLVERHEVFDDWTRIRNEWILIRRGRAKTFAFHHTVYSGQELLDRMEKAGFVELKLYGAFDGRDYGPAAQRLIAVGRKAVRRRGSAAR